MSVMFPSRPDMFRRPGRAGRGFSLVATIFILLLLGGLGAAAVNLATTQQTTLALDALGVRMYFAARSALEYGARQAVNSVCAPSTNLGIDGATVTVSCVSSTHDEGGAVVELYRLTATACSQPAGGACPNNSPGANYAERQLSMSVVRQ